METLEKSPMCRLCGKNNGIAVDIFDKNDNHVRKINAILPILVHEMDLLPKQMCHRCSYKLEEFYNFYEQCAKTDTELKSQLSWMRKENLEEKIMTPMVKVNRFKIKMEPLSTNDSDDPNNGFGKINEHSLIFPASILHCYDFDTSPILTCSRCRCICDGNINIGKQSPKEVKELLKETENQPRSSNFTPDISKKCNESPSESSEPKSVNNLTDLTTEIEDNCFRENNLQETSMISNGNKATKINCVKILKTEVLDRALRPRKGSVDYKGQKKKDVVSNLKTKLKSKLDMLSPSVVTPANIQITQSSMLHPEPIVKLEKVDDAIKSLRVRKNLEEFNRRIKEYHHKKNQEAMNESHNRRQFRKEHILSGIRPQDDTQLQRHLRKEDKKRRKSLHKEENINGNNIFTINESRRKSIQKTKNSNQQSCHVQENSDKQFLQKEVKGSKILQYDQSKTTEGKAMNKNFIIKQEPSQVTTQNNEISEVEILQEKCDIDTSEDMTIRKPSLEDRLTFDAVDKLKKDYTCNVNYPRIKIVRHSPVSNTPVLEDSTIKVNLTEQNKVCSKAKNQELIRDGSNISPKKLRSDNKRLQNLKDKTKLGKVTKKKRRAMQTIKVKRKVLEKESSNCLLLTNIIKYYCEECDVCFGNKELYKLHPCYQK